RGDSSQLWNRGLFGQQGCLGYARAGLREGMGARQDPCELYRAGTGSHRNGNWARRDGRKVRTLSEPDASRGRARGDRGDRPLPRKQRGQLRYRPNVRGRWRRTRPRANGSELRRNWVSLSITKHVMTESMIIISFLRAHQCESGILVLVTSNS